jgi:hypothetical protein
MSTKSKTLAKSLHTVSAIVAVARYMAGFDQHRAAEHVPAALHVLGYADAADPYGLAARAVAILEGSK